MDLAQLLARLRATSASFSVKHMVLIGAAFMAVVFGVIGWAYWSAPSYRLLFADMDPAAASEVVEKLKTQKIQYQIGDGGRAIRVPEDKIDELRLAMSAQGLPSSGRIGFEIFDRTSFGATEFLEHVNYRRALEGEIARTIMTLGEVASARVHIAMSKESLFESRSQQAKASVILKLKGRQGLMPPTVSGIASLVASSVEGLRPEAVVILDNFGRPLTQAPDEPSGFGVERQQRIERELSTRVVALLEPVVGVGRVRVNVAARLSAEAREETEERFDPTTVLRSRQTSIDSQQLAASAGGGPAIAGTRGNIAPAGGPPSATLNAAGVGTPGQPVGPTMSRIAETTNYEVSKLVRHSVVPRGELSRLWVAVILDDDVQMKKGDDGEPVRTQKPRTAEELKKIQGLVSAAVGLDQDRGDQLTVENVAFDAPSLDLGAPADGAPDAPGASSRKTLWVALGVGGVIVVLVLIVVAAKVFAPKKQRAITAGSSVATKVELPTTLPRTVQELQAEIEAQIDAEAKATGSQRLPVLAKRVGALTAKEPEAAALLVRSWLTEEQH